MNAEEMDMIESRLTSNNMDDRTVTFSYKFTQYPSTNFTFPPIAIFSTDKAHVSISAQTLEME